MLPQLVTEFSELSFTRVLEAELERHARDVVVQGLHVSVGTEQFQALAVGLPEEFNLE